MKCQSLFAGKKKKKINFLSAELYLRVVTVTTRKLFVVLFLAVSLQQNYMK